MLTGFACVCLHEPLLRACLVELRGEPGKLWKDFVDKTHLRSQVVLVDVKGKETANVAESSHDQDRRLFVGHNGDIVEFRGRIPSSVDSNAD